jgi:putative transposase
VEFEALLVVGLAPTPGGFDLGGHRAHRQGGSGELHPPEEMIPMTDDRLPLAELMAKTGDGDFLRTVAESVLQIMIEADVDGLIGAGRHERSGERTTWRNDFRDWTLDARLGTLNLKIPKLRTGAYFPGFLEPRKTVEKALVSVIEEAWIAGVSTRRVDDLAQAMGMSGISKASVSKLCKDIDERVNAFLKRPLAGDWPYLWLDATCLKVRKGGRRPAKPSTVRRLRS